MLMRIRPARLRILFEDGDVVAERQEVVGDGERRRTRTDECHTFAVLHGGGLGQPVGDVAAVVGRDALESADGDRFLLDTSAPARRFAGPVAGATRGCPERRWTRD
jgi:hypothetical protein